MSWQNRKRQRLRNLVANAGRETRHNMSITLDNFHANFNIFLLTLKNFRWQRFTVAPWCWCLNFLFFFSKKETTKYPTTTSAITLCFACKILLPSSQPQLLVLLYWLRWTANCSFVESIFSQNNLSYVAVVVAGRPPLL